MDKKDLQHHTGDMRLFSLNSNRPLAEKIANHLDLELGQVEIKKFSDGEIAINIGESVRGDHIYLLQSTHYPMNDYYMEIFIMADALRRASAASINLVMPYYGYARSDRKASSREPITAKLVANLMQRCGVDHVIAVDLHAAQIQGFFEIPLDHFTAQPVLANYYMHHYLQDPDQTVVVAPNHSAASIGRQYAEILNLPLSIMDNRMMEDGSESLEPIGQVSDRHCLIVDDLSDTGNTLVDVSYALMDQGAKSVNAVITHPVLSHDAADKILHSPLEKLITTDTISLREEQKNEKIEQISVAQLLADGISRVHQMKTTKPLFRSEYTDSYDTEYL